MMRFDPISCHGLPLRRFAITLIRHTTLGRIPLDEWSARRRDLYLTAHITHKRQTFMSLGGIRNRNPSKRAAADSRLRPRGHRDPHCVPTSLAVPQAVRRLLLAAKTKVRFQTALIQFVTDGVALG
jgi:hypothetical protein